MKIYLIALLGIMLSMALWCATHHSALESAPSGRTFNKDGEYLLGVGDEVSFAVDGQEKMKGNFKVLSSGYLNLPLIGSVLARGRTIKLLTAAVTTTLKPFVKSPRVTLAVVEHHSYRVYVSGEVKKPGEYTFKRPTSIIEAIVVAGGMTKFSSGDLVIIRKDLQNIRRRYTTSYSSVLAGRGNLLHFTLERNDVLHVD